MAEPTHPPEPFREIALPDGSDPIEKGLIRRVRSHEGTVTVDVAIDGLGENIAERVVEQIRGAALTLDDADHVRIQPVHREDSAMDLPEVDHVIAIASAKGGVGKSTVAVALARTLQARDFDVGLFDADIYGPNVPHLLDEEGPVLTNEHGQPIPIESDGVQMLSPGVAGGEPPTARRGAIAYGAVENMLAQGDWSGRDVLLIDMPAGSDDVAGAALEYVPLDGAVFVTTPFDASVDDTRRTIQLYEENDVSPIAAVVNMNQFTCECCGEPNTLFDHPVDVDVPVIHELPFDRTLQRNPGQEPRVDTLEEIATTVDAFITDLDSQVPECAIELRGLPVVSQARQIADELDVVKSGETVEGVVEDSHRVEDAVRRMAGELIEDVSRSQPGTTGVVLELSRT